MTSNIADVGSQTTSLNAELIELKIPNREASPQASIIGTQITLKGNTDLGELQGKLANEDTAVGLKVDLSDLPVELGGKKYAGLFLGGRVGIGILEPDAALHVKKITGRENDQTPLFQVDLDSTEAFVVSSTGNVSIGGTPEPNTRLTVHSSGQDTYALYVSANGTPAFVIKDGNVGIGKVPDPGSEYKLNVSGNMEVRIGGESRLKITESGVGIGEVGWDRLWSKPVWIDISNTHPLKVKNQ